MRPLVLALLALLLVPVAAAGKDRDAPVRVLWNSAPDDIQAHGTWDARVSVLQGPGGLSAGQGRPVIVVTDLASGAERRVPMTVDVPPNTFRATVAFPRAGLYDIAVAGFDPRDPARFTDIGPPVRIEPAPLSAGNAAATGGAWWLWAVVIGAAMAALAGTWRLQRARLRGDRLIAG
jgi:hypothetical protein